MVEETEGLVLINNKPCKIVNTESRYLPDGSTAELIKYRSLLKTDLSSEISEIISTDAEIKPISKIHDLGVFLGSIENTSKIKNLVVYSSVHKRIGILCELTEEDIGKCKANVAFFEQNHFQERIERIDGVDFNCLYPLLKNSPVFSNKSADKSVLYYLNHIIMIAYDSPADDKKKIYSAYFSSYVANQPKQLINIASDSISIHKLFLNIRKENTVISVPHLTFEGSFCNQHIASPVELLNSPDLYLNGYVALTCNTNDATKSEEVIGKVIELPCTENGNYVGIEMLNCRFQNTVTLRCGKKGIYVSPFNKNLKTICIGFKNIQKGTELCVGKFAYNGNQLEGKKIKVLDTITLKKKKATIDLKPRILESRELKIVNAGTPEKSDEDKMQQMVVNAAKQSNELRTSYLVEFEEDIGGHSGDGLGSPGRCLVIGPEIMRFRTDKLEPLDNLFQTRAMDGIFIDESAPRVLQECLDAINPEKVSGWLFRMLNGCRLDIENIVGKYFNYDSIGKIRNADSVPNLVVINGFVVPVASITCVSKLRRIEEIPQENELPTLKTIKNMKKSFMAKPSSFKVPPSFKGAFIKQPLFPDEPVAIKMTHPEDDFPIPSEDGFSISGNE